MEPNDNRFAMLCGPNDGGIKRGDRADTGDDQAGHKDGVGQQGSGVVGGDGGSTGNPTGATDSMAEPVDRVWAESEDVLNQTGDIDELNVTDTGDPNLGMTNIDDRPPEDWAANTGPSVNQEGAKEEIDGPLLEVPGGMAGPKKRKPGSVAKSKSGRKKAG